VLVPAQLRRRALETLEPLLIEPELERRLAASFEPAGAAPDPELAVTLRDAAESYVDQHEGPGIALLCTAAIRPLIAEFLDRSGLRLPVYSYAEIPPEMRIVPAAVAAAKLAA
jgi:flagellar biosynthesis component FlhA